MDSLLIVGMASSTKIDSRAFVCTGKSKAWKIDRKSDSKTNKKLMLMLCSIGAHVNEV